MGQKIIPKTDIIILCGGKGTRIREISKGNPKILMDIGGQPFLDILLDKLYKNGFRRVILSSGYLSHKIVSFLDNNRKKYQDKKLELIISNEEIPLGTGGAIKNAEKFIKSDPFFVMNGDVIFDLNFEEFFRFHFKNKAVLSMALAKPQIEKDYGVVLVDYKKRISGFREKSGEAGLISAGTYIMNKSLFNNMKKLIFSIEYDFFPLVLKKPCYGFLTEGMFIDIGTPERYRKVA